VNLCSKSEINQTLWLYTGWLHLFDIS